jgi:uncharacterized protein (DUF1697 family)
MTRYVAFLRGVSPRKAKMPDLKRCFEGAGLTNVKTVLSSGNVVFDATTKSEAALVRDVEAAMSRQLGHVFHTIVRPVSRLREMIESDPYAAFRLPANAKRIVTFLREPLKAKLSLPLERDGVRILVIDGREVFTVYVPNPKGAVSMIFIEKTFGTKVTTRTWETVKKCANA